MSLSLEDKANLKSINDLKVNAEMAEICDSRHQFWILECNLEIETILQSLQLLENCFMVGVCVGKWTQKRKQSNKQTNHK